MRFFIIMAMAGWLSFTLAAEVAVKKVDFLTAEKLEVNGAGPLLVRMDVERNRIILANTLTSSLTMIDGADRSVCNIPLTGRIPFYLKSEALAVHPVTGNIYVIGQRCLHIVYPSRRRSETVSLTDQYEMVAVNESNGDAFLVGRESRDLAWINARSLKVKRLPWAQYTERMANLNATPPPPIRKVAVDSALERVFVVDGYSPTLFEFSSRDGRLLNRRPLDLVAGARWHFGGYQPQSHSLYVVVETAERKVVQAARIDCRNGRDQIVALPNFTEAVGALFDRTREELYIPYDNHPSVHAVSFASGGSVAEIKVPAYGNDALALNEAEDTLYVSSWAYGEVDVIDLKTKKLRKRIANVGIIPHMFNMAFNPLDSRLYIPLGACAVNGSFGSAVTALDPQTEEKVKIRTGWAPVDFCEIQADGNCLVFNSEDEMAKVDAEGNFTRIPLPATYPRQTVRSFAGDVYLAYGPHQSYWPVVYIWGARNGILGIESRTLGFYDRRIPRLAQALALDRNGVLYAQQNNWGEEKQFLMTLPDDIRAPNQGDSHLELPDTVLRETTQRILTYDPENHALFLVRVGEKDEDQGTLQIIDLASRSVSRSIETGCTPTSLAFDRENIFITNFDSHTLTQVPIKGAAPITIRAGRQPVKVALLEGIPYVINHRDNTLREVSAAGRVYRIPGSGMADNLAVIGSDLYITSHSPQDLRIVRFDTESKTFHALHREIYPYGDTAFDTANAAFFMRGQFGDGIFAITSIRGDGKGRVWISDFLSGKLFIITESKN